MAKSKTVSTIFDTTSSNAKTADASTVAAANPINQILPTQTATTSLVNGLLGGLATSLIGNSSALNSALTAAQDTTALVNRASNLGNDFTKNIDSLGGKVLTSILTNSGFVGDNAVIVDGLLGASKGKPLSEMIKYQSNQVKLVVNGTQQLIKDIKDFDTHSLTSVMTLLNGVMGQGAVASLIDASAELTMLKVLNDAALKLGLSKAIDSIFDYDTDASNKRILLLDGLPLAVQQSNLYYIRKAVSVSGAGACWARCPDIIGDIITYYQLPTGVTVPTSAECSELIQTLNTLSSTWRYANVSGTQKINLSIFYRANEVSKQTLMLEPSLVSPLLIANNFPAADTLTTFKQFYPIY